MQIWYGESGVGALYLEEGKRKREGGRACSRNLQVWYACAQLQKESKSCNLHHLSYRL